MMKDYSKLPYAKWLEEAIKALVEIDPDTIYFGLIKNGEVISSYYDFDTTQRALLIQEMLTLSVLDKLEDHIDEMICDLMSQNTNGQNLSLEENENEEDEDESYEGLCEWD